MTRRFAHLAALVLAAGALISQVGCATQGDGDTGEDEDGTGLAQIAISEVPSDGSVGCIVVKATGSHSVTRSKDVVPGQSALLDLKGLPVGTVSFTGRAYQGPCDAVTPAAVPTWLSDPVLASVNNVQPVTVHLSMHKNGKATVDVDFEEDPACGAAGAPCLDSAECCSQSCVEGACSAEPPACGPGLTSCDGVCVDLMSDPSSCGACGSLCPPGSTCEAGVCMLPNCFDGIMNGTETAVDCGGPVCAPCGPWLSCQVGSDCSVGICLGGACAECATALDCPGVPTECQTPACTSGLCSTLNAPFGTMLSTQTPGDCQVVQCNGAGFEVTFTDNTDIPNDGNDCTIDMCTSVPVHVFAPAGTPCGPNGSMICDGSGTCF